MCFTTPQPAARITWSPPGKVDASPRSIDLRGLPREALPPGCKVLVAGVGAVGGIASETFARLGVRQTLIDPDSYGPDSWRTQPCFADDAGLPKVDVQASRMRRINPSAAVRTGCGFIQDVHWQVLYEADVLVAAGDNLQMLVYLGRMAAALGKDLCNGAVHGETFSAICRRWRLSDSDSACPACALGDADWSRLALRRGCDLKEIHALVTTPTQTAPFVCAMAGQMLAAEALMRLIGDPGQPAAREVLYSLQSHRLYPTELVRNPDCRCPHAAWVVELLAHGPERLTFDDLLQHVGHRSGWRGLEVSSELPWCQTTVCGGCRREQPVRRFAHAGDHVGRCVCGAPLVAIPQGLRRTIPSIDLKQRAGQPLAESGLPSGRAVVIEDGESPPWCGFVGPLCDVPHFPDGPPDPSRPVSPEQSTS